MRALAQLFRPDRRRVLLALALSAVICLGYFGTYAFAEDKSQTPLVYRWLWPLTIVAWPAWVAGFWPLAMLSKTLFGTDAWVWDMGANPAGLLFSYIVASLGVRVFDRWSVRK